MIRNIVTTYHHGFAGGSKNTSRLLHYLSENGCNVDGFFFEIPQYFTYTKSRVKTHVFGSNGIHAEVVDPNLMRTYSVTDKIVQELKCISDPILFGANLFPYCNLLLDAKIQLAHLKENEPKLMIHPVGSDIWQIGVQLRSRVKWLLNNPLVDSVVTYSESFATEIEEYFDINREICILPPVLERDKFYPISDLEKSERRKVLGLNDDVFIMHHHSSMRKIKCPEIVLDIAIKSSELISEKCVLVMTGPIPYTKFASLNLNLIRIRENSIFIYKAVKDNLIIYLPKVLSNVEYLIQISDVELNASIHDSFNISLMEAMACGIPVVSSDVVGIGEHILKAEAGLCFPTKKLKLDQINAALHSEVSMRYFFDVDYAVSAIVSFAENRSTARLKGALGALYVEGKFNIEKVSKEFHSYI